MADSRSSEGTPVRGVRRAAFTAAGAFAVLGIAWILLSDTLVSMIGNPAIRAHGREPPRERDAKARPADTGRARPARERGRAGLSRPTRRLACA